MAEMIDVINSRLRKIQARATTSAPRAVVDSMQKVMKTEIERQLDLKHHAPGTPTPSSPGEPPAYISGRLHDSVKIQRPHSEGLGTIVGEVGATAIYARIHEFGGNTGRNHATYLPPRPYLQPAIHNLTSTGALTALAVRVFVSTVYR